MLKHTRAGRVMAASLIACFALSGLLAAPGAAQASYAVPTAQLRNGALVDLDNGRILTGPDRGQSVSKAQLERLRTKSGFHAGRSVGQKGSP